MIDYKSWFETHFSQIKKDYFQFLRFKSISADPQYANEIELAANWVCSYLNQSGLEAEIVQTKGYPLVYAQTKLDPSKPTVLFYGHYDVQPVEPLELWNSDPFEPVEKDGVVFARGAVDDKGQIFYAMVAIRSLLEMESELPVNIKFCIEGEEESSSLGLQKSLNEIKDRLRADYLIVVDHDCFDEKTPAVNLGARGMIALEIELKGSESDLHSGMYGGIAYNPNRALVELLSKLYDENGKVAIEGFYDDVDEPSDQEKKQFASRTKDFYKQECKILAFGGEKGKTIQEASLFRPTLEINGIGGGHFGKGFKTVIPAKAIAKISCRLVPHQNPEKIGKMIEKFLKKHCPSEISMKIEIHPGAPAYRASGDTKIAKAVASAAAEVMGRPCQFVLTGGSIPIIATLTSAIGAEVVGMGYCLDTDQIHAPNEHFGLNRFKYGFLTVVGAIKKL